MKVLVVVDMQKDFIDGALGSPEAQAIVPNVIAKIAEYKKNGVILFTRDTHFNDYMNTQEGKYLPVPHCIKNTEGWVIPKEILPNEIEAEVVDKYTFGRRNIADDVWIACGRKYGRHDIESIEVVGLCTDICVVSNVLILKSVYHEIPIIVDSKCCAGVTPAKHEAALEVMRSCQVEVL